jgi:hypothetical protein
VCLERIIHQFSSDRWSLRGNSSGQGKDVCVTIGPILAVAHLGNHALETGLAGVLEHLTAINVEALTELDIGFVDQLF